MPERLRVDEGGTGVAGRGAAPARPTTSRRTSRRCRSRSSAEPCPPASLPSTSRPAPAWIARKAPVPSRKSGSAISGHDTATGQPRSSSVTSGRSATAGASTSRSSYSRWTVPTAGSSTQTRATSPSPGRADRGRGLRGGEPVDLLRDRHGDRAPGRRLAQRRERAPGRPDGEARPAGDGQATTGWSRARPPAGTPGPPAAGGRAAARRAPSPGRRRASSRRAGRACRGRPEGGGCRSSPRCAPRRAPARGGSRRAPAGRPAGRGRRPARARPPRRASPGGSRTAPGASMRRRPPTSPSTRPRRSGPPADLALQLPHRGGDGRQPERRLETEPVPGGHEVRESGQGRVVVPAPRVGDRGDDPGVRVAAGLQLAKLLDAAGVGLPHRGLVGAQDLARARWPVEPVPGPWRPRRPPLSLVEVVEAHPVVLGEVDEEPSPVGHAPPERGRPREGRTAAIGVDADEGVAHPAVEEAHRGGAGEAVHVVLDGDASGRRPATGPQRPSRRPRPTRARRAAERR